MEDGDEVEEEVEEEQDRRRELGPPPQLSRQQRQARRAFLQTLRPSLGLEDGERWPPFDRQSLSWITRIDRTIAHVIFTPTELSSDSEPDTWEYGGRVELPVPPHDMFWDVHLQWALVARASRQLSRALKTGDIIIANFRGPAVPTGCWECDRGYHLDPMDLQPLPTTSDC